MRILHILHQYLPDFVGGTEFYTQAVAGKQVEAGHDVFLFVPAVDSKDWPEAADENGLKVYRCPISSWSTLRRFSSTFSNNAVRREFETLLDFIDPDIIHVQHLMGMPAALIESVDRRGIPYVVTLHDYWYICANAQLLTNYDSSICEGPNLWINCARCALARVNMGKAAVLSPFIAPIFTFRDRMLRKVLKGAENLIAPTEFVKGVYEELGLGTGKITVIPHGIELPEIVPIRQSVSAGVLRVGYVGGLSWQKGVHILVQAFNEIPADRATLSLWGDIDAFPAYVSELRNLAKHTGITFEGTLPRDQLWDVLSQFDVVVIPSLWYETASLIIQEAFAVGVPVVASDLGALATRVREGIDGLLIPPGDAAVLRDTLRTLLDDLSLLARLKSGIQPVFTISQHVLKIEDLYSSAVR